jgi:hypothetical protein
MKTEEQIREDLNFWREKLNEYDVRSPVGLQIQERIKEIEWILK